MWSRRRRVVMALVAGAVALALYVSVSLGVYVAQHSADPLQQNVATWGRNHHLGFLVNRLERWLHSDPPSAAPAAQLALADAEVETVAPTVSNSTTTAPSTSVTVVPVTAGSSAAPSSSLPAVPEPVVPESIVPVIAPALEGEGVWNAVATLDGHPVVWSTSVRPLGDYGSVVATAAVFDPGRLHAALFNGPEIPGGKGWNNGNHVMKAAQPSLIATFNGGFRFEHFKGGYVTEGRTVRKLRANEATMAIDRSGRLKVGVWGKDLLDDGTWVSIRQNLPPVVMDGVVSIKKFPGTYWGNDFHHVTFTFRSAICSRRDGLLMYVAMGDVDITLLGRGLVAMGCVTAMQLDINGNWPQFDTYRGFGETKRSPVLLDRRMSNAARYLRHSDKDFIALFDPETLPSGTVR